MTKIYQIGNKLNERENKQNIAALFWFIIIIYKSLPLLLVSFTVWVKWLWQLFLSIQDEDKCPFRVNIP